MPAHKIVLTTRSPMFQGMLNSGMREGSEGVVAVEGVRAPVFKALLHFVYTDSLPEVSLSSQGCAIKSCARPLRRSFHHGIQACLNGFCSSGDYEHHPASFVIKAFSNKGLIFC